MRGAQLFGLVASLALIPSWVGAQSEFDSRLENPQFLEKREAWKTSSEFESRKNKAESFRNLNSGVVIDFAPHTGGVEFVRSRNQGVSLYRGRVGQSPAEVVRDFIAKESAWLGLTPDDFDELASFKPVRNAKDHRSQSRVAWYQQRLQNIEVFEAEVRAALNSKNEIIMFSNRSLSENLLQPYALPPEADLQANNFFIGEDQIEKGRLKNHIVSNTTAFEKALDALDIESPHALRMRRWIYFPISPTEVRLALRFVVDVPREDHLWDIILDAQNLEVLYQKDWTVDFRSEDSYANSFLVWADASTGRPYDSPRPMMPNSLAPGNYPGLAAPMTFQASEIPQELVFPTMDPTYSPLGWTNPSGYTTGNNADAYCDWNADLEPDIERPNNEGGGFITPVDLSAYEPGNNINGSIINAFYLANWFHDQMYARGFDEESGNFQADNFGLGGEDGDSISMLSQYGYSENQFNGGSFSGLPLDGWQCYVKMKLWNFPNPDRDSAFDAHLVLHELAHGMSFRLSGGGFTQEQGVGLYEGYSDFFSLSLLAKPDQPENANFVTGPYIMHMLGGGFEENYYYGARMFPYSPDMSKNPMTYSAVSTTNGAQFANVTFAEYNYSSYLGSFAPLSEPHNVGHLFNSILWDLREGIIKHYLSSPEDPMPLEQARMLGNEKVLQLVVNALKLSPGLHNFIYDRDALFLAASLEDDAEDLYCLIANAFRRRGVGATAEHSPYGTQILYGIHPSLTPFEVCANGDVNGDGNLTAADLGALLSQWTASDSSADMNADGIVNSTDLACFLAFWQ